MPEERRSWTQLRVFVKDQRELNARFSRTEYFGNFTKAILLEKTLKYFVIAIEGIATGC